MVLYVRDLGQIEKRELESWLASDDPDLQHRARVVLLSALGYRVPEISEKLNAHPANLRKWIHRFNQESCEGLMTVRAGGAKPRISEDQKARIVALARRRPRELGLTFTSWTLHKLADAAQKREIVDSISHESIRQILMDADCSYRSAAR